MQAHCCRELMVYSASGTQSPLSNTIKKETRVCVDQAEICMRLFMLYMEHPTHIEEIYTVCMHKQSQWTFL